MKLEFKLDKRYDCLSVIKNKKIYNKNVFSQRPTMSSANVVLNIFFFNENLKKWKEYR